MSGVNRVILLGRLGSDPELKETKGGNVAKFSLATSREWTDESGKRQSNVQWHKIVVWGKLADLCGKYLVKGQQAYVEGELETRSWEKDGETKWTTEVIAKNIQFLGGSKPLEESAQNESPAALTSKPAKSTIQSSDELPF